MLQARGVLVDQPCHRNVAIARLQAARSSPGGCAYCGDGLQWNQPRHGRPSTVLHAGPLMYGGGDGCRRPVCFYRIISEYPNKCPSVPQAASVAIAGTALVRSRTDPVTHVRVLQ